MHTTGRRTVSAFAIAPAWTVHLPTVDRTVVRLAGAPVGPRTPWPIARVAHELTALGARRCGRPDAVGDGHRVPVLCAQLLTLDGVPLQLQTVVLIDGDSEVELTLPPWDALCASWPDEELLWLVVDAVAAAVDARCGVIGDGDACPPATEGRSLARALAAHYGVLVPDPSAVAPSAAAEHRELPRSQLTVLLR
jgi:hypothetical protein